MRKTLLAIGVVSVALVAVAARVAFEIDHAFDWR